MNRKGFTLIELIAVITIMGMVLVVTIPATGRLIASNDKRLYDEYYTVVAGAANKYAKGEFFNLGGISSSGCVELNSLDTLIDLGLLKSFTINDEDVECYLPSELDSYTKVSQSALENLKDGKGPSDFYDIRITNNKGKISIVHSMVCVRDNRTIVYKRLVPKDGSTCSKYEQEQDNILSNKLLNDSSSITDGTEGTKFYTGSNYYVKYSGKLWQVVSIDQDGKIKLLSDDIVSAYSYFPKNNDPANTTISYTGSNVKLFNDNVFKNTLRSPTIYLDTSAKWNFGNVENGENPPVSDVSKEDADSIVGLLNLYEFDKIKDRFSSSEGKWFLISQKDDSTIWVANKNEVSNLSGTTFSGIRPSVILNKNITFLPGGTGTKTNPYVLIGEQSALAGDKLSTRYAGEYVTFDKKTYRIISTSEEGTKIISTDYSMEGKFDETDKYQFDETTKIATNMQENYYSTIDNQNLIEKQKYCIKSFFDKTILSTTCEESDKKEGYYSVPMIGDMYTVFTDNSYEKYWTITPSEITKDPITNEVVDPKVNIIDNVGVTPSSPSETAKYYPVILISPGAKITGGDGLNTPYTIA